MSMAHPPSDSPDGYRRDLGRRTSGWCAPARAWGWRAPPSTASVPRTAAPRHRGASAPGTAAEAQRRGAPGRPGPPALGALRGCLPLHPPCDPAGGGPVPLLGAHPLPHPGRRGPTARAPPPAPPPPLRQARAAGHRSQPTVVLGYHQAQGPSEVDLLLPLRDPRCLQPLRGRLDGRHPRDGRPGRAVHRRHLRQARHRPQTSSPCTPTAAPA